MWKDSLWKLSFHWSRTIKTVHTGRWSRGEKSKYFLCSFFVTFYWLNIYFIYCYYNKIMFKISYIIVPTWVATMWKLSFYCFRISQRVDTGDLEGTFSIIFSCLFLWLFITLIYKLYTVIILKLSLKSHIA
jgi:hypothetical protein